MANPTIARRRLSRRIARGPRADQPAATEAAVRRALLAAVIRARFRDIVGAFPTGVTVVTARGADGPAGLTTNAFTSLSLDPPLMLVCFDNGSRTLPVVRETRRFAVNVLRAGQEDARRGVRLQARAGREVRRRSPRRGSTACRCSTTRWPGWPATSSSCCRGGDHTIGIGAVTALARVDGEPLVFFRGGTRGCCS